VKLVRHYRMVEVYTVLSAYAYNTIHTVISWNREA